MSRLFSLRLKRETSVIEGVLDFTNLAVRGLDDVGDAGGCTAASSRGADVGGRPREESPEALDDKDEEDGENISGEDSVEVAGDCRSLTLPKFEVEILGLPCTLYAPSAPKE